MIHYEEGNNLEFMEHSFWFVCPINATEAMPPQPTDNLITTSPSFLLKVIFLELNI